QGLRPDARHRRDRELLLGRVRDPDHPPAGDPDPVNPHARAVRGGADPVKDILGKRNYFFLLSLAIIVPGMISMATMGFRLGIAFTGGDRITVHYRNGVSLQDVQREMDTFHVDAVVQAASGSQAVITT